MSTVSKLFELFAVNRQLSTSKPYVLKALGSLAVIIFLGVFGTFLLGMLVSIALWILFTQMLADGATLLVACLTVLAVALLILGIVFLVVTRMWRQAKADIEHVFRIPLISPVADTVGGVAGAFFKGLRHKRDSK